jgi:hypothetical protein
MRQSTRVTENGKKTRVERIHRDRSIPCGCLGCPCESGHRQRGEFHGNAYHEKGIILQYQPERLLKYSHWSDLEQLPDLPENYRHWTFRIESGDPGVVLSVTEDNIPDETKRARSDEFWSGVLSTIKGIVEAGT